MGYSRLLAGFRRWDTTLVNCRLDPVSKSEIVDFLVVGTLHRSMFRLTIRLRHRSPLCVEWAMVLAALDEARLAARTPLYQPP